MTFETTTNSLDKISSDVVVVFAFEGKNELLGSDAFIKFDKKLKGALVEAAKAEKFIGKKNTNMMIRFPSSMLSSKVVVVGLGKKSEVKEQDLRKVFAKISKSFAKKIDSLALSLLSSSEFKSSPKQQAYIIAEGLLLGSYSFAQYKKKDKSDRDFNTIIFSSEKAIEKDIKSGIKKAETYYNATKVARDLVNEQAAVATPTYLANLALAFPKKDKRITCRVYDKKEVEKMGMEAFLGVARASDTPPKFIVLHYKPIKPSKKKLAIVGKGITFDSGGINIKPENSMVTMKCDMSGAAAVLGVFSVISDISPSIEVLGIIAATPNLISGTSLVPGDVVRAMNGKTIEVLNTDAEGRVTMADSLSYAVKENATEIIDLATLTGACVVALGDDIAGLMTNNKELARKVLESSERVGEDVWELPLPREYKDLNKSEVADIANIPKTRWGGAITAGLFLEEFVDNKPWVHLDIAGPAFAEGEFALGPKGGTGFGVRLLLNLLQNS